MTATAQAEAHRVVLDYVGFNPRPRLTCMEPGCGGATLVRQPYMNETQWREKKRAFDEAHPCPEYEDQGVRG